MKVKSSQDRSSQVRTSLVREGVWNTRKDPKFLKAKFFWSQNYFGPKNVLDFKMSLDPKCHCNQKYFGPKIFSDPRFYGPKILLVQKISAPKLNTFTWESSVALLSPTCLNI